MEDTSSIAKAFAEELRMAQEFTNGYIQNSIRALERVEDPYIKSESVFATKIRTKVSMYFGALQSEDEHGTFLIAADIAALCIMHLRARVRSKTQ